MKEVICSFMEHVLGNATILAIVGAVIIALAGMTLLNDQTAAKEIALLCAGGVLGAANCLTKKASEPQPPKP